MKASLRSILGDKRIETGMHAEYRRHYSKYMQLNLLNNGTERFREWVFNSVMTDASIRSSLLTTRSFSQRK